MSLTQELLRAEAARRIRSLHPDLAARLDVTTTAGLLAAQDEIAGAAEDTQMLGVTVVRRFELASWIRETCRFASTVDPQRAALWRRSFTRTVFLAGNPENLRDRFAFDHVAQDWAAAWVGPAPAGASTDLRRLLKIFEGTHAVPAQPPTTVEIPVDRAARRRPPVRRDLYLATAALTISGCLVHLNHLLVEAVLDGLIVPGDVLTLHQRPGLAGVPVPFAALRVAAEPAHPDRLRAYAGLTEEIDHV